MSSVLREQRRSFNFVQLDKGKDLLQKQRKNLINKADNKAYVEEAFVILGSPGESYAVNTLDNLIMVHNMNAKSTMLFDIKGVPSEHGPSITGLSQSIKGHAAVIEAAPIKSPSGQTLNVYQAQMSFFQPNLVIDHRNGRLWDIELRLDKVWNQRKSD